MYYLFISCYDFDLLGVVFVFMLLRCCCVVSVVVGCRLACGVCVCLRARCALLLLLRVVVACCVVRRRVWFLRDQCVVWRCLLVYVLL